MLDTKKIPDKMLEDILQSLGYDAEGPVNADELGRAIATVRQMTPFEAFEKWCQWHGLQGSLPARLIRVLRAMENAEEIKAEVPR